MSLIEETTFTHENKEYVIRAFQESDKIIVRVFQGNKPITPITYSVHLDTNFDFYAKHGKAGYKKLFAIAKNDFIEKPWER